MAKLKKGDTTFAEQLLITHKKRNRPNIYENDADIGGILQT